MPRPILLKLQNMFILYILHELHLTSKKFRSTVKFQICHRKKNLPQVDKPFHFLDCPHLAQRTPKEMLSCRSERQLLSQQQLDHEANSTLEQGNYQEAMTLNCSVVQMNDIALYPSPGQQPVQTEIVEMDYEQVGCLG